MTIITTTFPNTENPLDDPWVARITTLLTDMRSTPGKAFGNAAGIGAYDDSAALLSGLGLDTEIDCGVFLDPTLDTDATHECELLTRATQTTGVAQQIESLFAFFGSVQGVEWIDDGGQNFDFLTSIYGDGGIGGNFTTGDRIRTRHVGTRIHLSAFNASNEETILAVYQSDTPTTGQPGIGAFTRVADGGVATKFCFTDAKVTDEFSMEQLGADTFARGNSDPVDGSWNTPTGLGTMRLAANKVRASTTGQDSAMRFTGLPTDPLPLDQFVQITVATLGDGDGGFMLECQDNGDMIIGTGYTGTDLFIFERISGSFNQLGSVAIPYALGQEITAWRHGSYVILFVDAVEVLRVEQKTLVGGEPGIFGYGTIEFNNFKAGKIVAGYGDTIDVDGDVDGTFAAITAAVLGKATNPATVVATMPAITAAITGNATNPAIVDGTLPAITGAATGNATNPGTVVAVMPAITSSSTGKATNPGTVDGTFPAITAAAVGKATNPALVLGTFAPAEAAAVGSTTNPGTVVGTFPAAEGSAVGKATNPATVIGTFLPATSSATGTVNPPVSGTVVGTMPAITVSASGSFGSLVTGVVVGTFPPATGEALGSVSSLTVEAIVLGTFAAATGFAFGEVDQPNVVFGAVDATFAPITMQALGEFKPARVFGTVDGTFPAATVSAFDVSPGFAIGVVRLSAVRRNLRFRAIER